MFYIYPTLFVDRKDENWNSDIFNPSVRKDVIEKAVVNQASAWVKAANLYVPYYRQAHYRIFVEPYAVQGKQAAIIAYQDVKKAFKYFLKNFNQRRRKKDERRRKKTPELSSPNQPKSKKNRCQEAFPCWLFL